MSEMSLILESWRGFVNEQDSEVSVGQFIEAFAKYMPNAAQKVLGNKLFQNALKISSSVAAGIATGGAGGALGGAVVGELFSKIADAADPLAKMMADAAKKQVSDEDRAGLDNYWDIDDAYEKLIGGMNSSVGKDFIKELYVEYVAAFTKFKDLEKEAKARGEDSAELLNLPLTSIGITMSADEFFKHMIAGKEPGAELASMGGDKVAVQKINEGLK